MLGISQIFKLLGSVLIIAASYQIGASIHRQQIERYKIICLISQMLSEFEDFVKYEQGTTIMFFTKCAENEMYSRLTFLEAVYCDDYREKPLPDRLSEALCYFGKDFLKNDECEIVSDIFKFLNSQNKQILLNKIKFGISRLNMLSEALEKSLNGKKRLYETVSVTIGVTVAILLI